ncbi:tetratricopeptide repeat protein [Altererythrobacter sp. TH136]|uniref:tetratricopeptide repeat protein n=1 Tax=Altererythrobacter sp. TH136 TaxID=2067415 RepID=UPI001163EB24|nr:tetratricopeptide repeat protein [Altererythrobacter sp. TH136]QDM40136.1 tetratricopeptide repeat protein [Altererythrobacter sp. TH136]
MRYAVPAAALAAVLAVTASVGQGNDHVTDPRAAALVAQGRANLAAGEPEKAVDAFEAALTIDPAATPIFLNLAEAARLNGLQGKAIRYYRLALEREPDNLAALSGEGAALVEKGAVEKARRNLAKLQSICGDRCAETAELAAAIAKGPQQRVLTAEAVMPDAVVTQQN